MNRNQSDYVSVVVPAYNYGRYLSSAIDSALAQTYPHLEVIVVDDGSTDDTAIVAKNYGSKIRYIHQTNAGLSAARNRGVRAASFGYILFLDADDVLMPDMLETIMGEYARLSPDFGLVACGSIRFHTDGKFQDSKSRVSKETCELRARDILLKTRFMPSTAVVKRVAFDECGTFDTELRSSEDRDMWIRIGTRYRMFYLSKSLVRIRKHDDNMSKNADRMKTNMRHVIFKAFRNRVVSRANAPFWLQVYSINFFEVSWMNYDEDRIPKAVREILCSLLLWPLPMSADDLNEPKFFRIRALVRFLLSGLVFRKG